MLPVELLSYHYYRRFLDTTQLACVAGGFFFLCYSFVVRKERDAAMRIMNGGLNRKR